LNYFHESRDILITRVERKIKRKGRWSRLAMIPGLGLADYLSARKAPGDREFKSPPAHHVFYAYYLHVLSLLTTKLTLDKMGTVNFYSYHN